jgi:hypothetical protein
MICSLLQSRKQRLPLFPARGALPSSAATILSTPSIAKPARDVQLDIRQANLTLGLLRRTHAPGQPFAHMTGRTLWSGVGRWRMSPFPCASDLAEADAAQCFRGQPFATQHTRLHLCGSGVSDGVLLEEPFALQADRASGGRGAVSLVSSLAIMGTGALILHQYPVGIYSSGLACGTHLFMGPLLC